MAKGKLFYGDVSNVTIYRNGANNFIRVRFDVVSGATTLTGVVDHENDYVLDFADVLVGQQLVAAGSFPSGTTITAIDTSAQTIEVSDAALTGESGEQARISPPKGQYFISGSITKPQNVDFTAFDVTGSHDSEYNDGDNKWGVLLAQASTSSLNAEIAGDFSQYEISRVKTRPNSAEISAYITSSANGILVEEPGKAISSAQTTNRFSLIELSYSSSLGPIWDRSSGGTVQGGSNYAAYQIALQEYYDDLRVGIYHSGSQVIGNADFINFTGSAVKSITTESIGNQNGVLIKIEGGGGDTFPYTGSAEITGSLGLTGSFQIESGSTKPFTVNADGTVQLFAHENSYNPTPLLGGIYFTSQSVFLGLED